VGDVVVVVAHTIWPELHASMTALAQVALSLPLSDPQFASISSRHERWPQGGGSGQPAAAVHASQQLGALLTHASPLRGARHESASRLVLQSVRPLAVVRQHVTKPSRPHVDRAAQRTTSPWHSCRRSPLATASFATPATQLTYCPWLSALAQGHC
jgi:hypothetical protein